MYDTHDVFISYQLESSFKSFMQTASLSSEALNGPFWIRSHLALVKLLLVTVWIMDGRDATKIDISVFLACHCTNDGFKLLFLCEVFVSSWFLWVPTFHFMKCSSISLEWLYLVVTLYVFCIMTISKFNHMHVSIFVFIFCFAKLICLRPIWKSACNKYTSFSQLIRLSSVYPFK